jgi:WhiB family transcriptional regulator, redox-sensing transcriptional regulator
MRSTAGTRTPVDEHQLDWRDDAECVHYATEVNFFPARGESVREAKAVCATCPVRRPCLDYAMQWDHLSGVWGGLSERERRLLRRRRRRGHQPS